ncbi:DEAD/DEAH box helicase [Nonomuraea spiralis]|uniref:DEAD/DEAH box helicase n=1 Tax=Nonomuraea spiralis TaxID=46182 RepID=A0ABV5IMY7_9ACTN|nr:DEAD/DEAH box helicase [Nonomuraea spiralis]GGT38545.1 ATP-dependent helicase [Nonomuraea spiralis]
MDALHPSLVHHIVNTLGWRSLRPLQAAAIRPVLDGADCLLLAPTAGGKTEAVVFPVLSAAAWADSPGLRVIYVCPLKALLNNLRPRLDDYASWLGLSVALWHGDVGAGQRAAILREPPDLLLTTPESLEAMLVSAKVEHAALFRGLRTVIIDEVHAFAGDDRGWHLLSVLERLTRLAGRPIQRVGLSATVGNPDELLAWLQGGNRGVVPAEVVNPSFGDADASSTGITASPSHSTIIPVDLELDFVGSVLNAAKVIAALHKGEKRLVFCDSRKRVEELAAALRALDVTTYVSHASLALDERRAAEEAFASARDCVIVSTSTLELGIDVGDLDRVVQLDAPTTVASFLQRLGRTGRRYGTARNCLFLTLSDQGLLHAAGLLLLWSQGWVEPVKPPPSPMHIVAQQLLALCLQENAVGDHMWRSWWPGLKFFDEAEPILTYLVDRGFLERDGGLLFIGPEAEKRFGRRHFMELTAVFTAPPAFIVFAGRAEVGTIDSTMLAEPVEGPRLLLLGGRSWRVTAVDWSHRRCFVEPADGGGRIRWSTDGGGPDRSFQLTRAMRAVVLGETPSVRLTSRAVQRLARIRDDLRLTAQPDSTVLLRSNDASARWWTWGGTRANATLIASMPGISRDGQRVGPLSVLLRHDVTFREPKENLRPPRADDQALKGLKFSAALPEDIARNVLAERLADASAAYAILREPRQVINLP